MPTNNYKRRDLVLALLSLAKEKGLKGVTRTALTKWVYLADCEFARANEGHGLSGSEWIFLHFGPYSEALDADLNSWSQSGVLNLYEGSFGGTEYATFSLPAHSRPASLTEIGIPARGVHTISLLMQKFAGDLSRLLDFVYFKTAPMHDASPGSALNLASAASDAPETTMRKATVSDQTKQFRILQLLNALEERRKKAPSVEKALQAHRSILDGEFSRALEQMDGEVGEFTPVAFTADLT